MFWAGGCEVSTPQDSSLRDQTCPWSPHVSNQCSLHTPEIHGWSGCSIAAQLVGWLRVLSSSNLKACQLVGQYKKVKGCVQFQEVLWIMLLNILSSTLRQQKKISAVLLSQHMELGMPLLWRKNASCCLLSVHNVWMKEMMPAPSFYRVLTMQGVS